MSKDFKKSFDKWKAEAPEESINVRVIKFASRYPQSVSYLDLKKRYERRDSDWDAVKKMLDNAIYNYDHDSGRVIPFVVLERKEPYAIDNCTYTLSYEASFSLLGYRTAIISMYAAITAAILALISILISICSS